MFGGSRASSTRGQAPLCPHRRPPRPQHLIFSIFRRGGLHFGRHTNQSHARTATKQGELRCERCTVELTPRRGRHQTGGNCTNRGATRRRHAEGRLLMVQNPHRQPDIHPGAEGGGPEATGALRDTGLATAPAGGDPTTSRQMSHVSSPRSLFKITRKRCNSNDVDSTFELIAWELRAKLRVDSHSWASGQRTEQHQQRRPHRRGGVAGVKSVLELPASHVVWPIKPMSAIFHRGGMHCGRHVTPNRDLTASKRGELHH